MKRTAEVWPAGLLASAIAMTAIADSGAAPAPSPAIEDFRPAFARPDGLPARKDRPTSQAAVELGRTLFEDTRLSGDGTMSCATCHQAALAFADGEPLHTGRDGKPLDRNTPALWNLAWAETLFWDGRASSLEQQALGPIENPREMAGNAATAIERLKADPKMQQAFAAAFPEAPAITAAHLTSALAAYEQTLVSPPTRFDAWVAGDDRALDADEKAGFALFLGKAECVTCHSGWRFTDEAFHDIGLPTTSGKGRGPIIGVPAVDYAFKTPSLRELAWTAPYMHDGSMATLEAVVEHYASGAIQRPTLSKDMPPVVSLSETERQQLIAFLGALSSENAPRPPSALPKIEIAAPAGQTVPVSTLTVGQKDKRFTPNHVVLKAGESLTIVNDDKRIHNVRIDDPRMPFTSNGQEPGDEVVIPFTQDGEFAVICSIHPTMHLTVTVAPGDKPPGAPRP